MIAIVFGFCGYYIALATDFLRLTPATPLGRVVRNVDHVPCSESAVAQGGEIGQREQQQLNVGKDFMSATVHFRIPVAASR